MIGVVVVSHSAALARGVAELAAEMAPDVTVAVAGGTDDGEVGTSLDLVSAALAEADSGDGAVVLSDLGSATMTAEMALELLDDDQRARVALVDAPLVEGAIAAATTAGGGAGLDEVRAAAEQAGGSRAAQSPPAADAAVEADAAAGGQAREVVLRNPLGLHARPAALLVRRLAGLDAGLRVTRTDTGQQADGRSVLGLVTLAAPGGAPLRLTATGPDAAAALDAVAAMIEEGFGERTLAAEQPAAGPPAGGKHGELVGLAAAPGLAVGPAQRLRTAALEAPDTPGRGEVVERERLEGACERVRTQLADEGGGVDGAQQGILAAHAELLADPELAGAAQEGLAAGASAEVAWRDAVEGQRARVAALEDPMFAARAADVADVGRRVLAVLLGTVSALQVDPGAVVLADDLVPSQVPELATGGAAGVALAGGAPGSHVAVLARGLGLPLVVGLGPALEAVAEGRMVVLDGDAGTLLPEPSSEALRRAEARRDTERRAAEADLDGAAEPVRTSDGVTLRVGANIAGEADARRASALGADEFGLVRTELAFLGRDTLPDEDTQVALLRGILEAADGRPVVVRTLDIGGDKAAPALDLDPVRNGFLGLRGLRWSLANPEVFAVQLRAVLRAADGHRVRLMFPLVTAAEEVADARRALDAARAALDAEGVARGDVEQVGVMVEVPAAAVAADLLAPHVDFFSVGSNDLLSYLMAADRTLPEVAALRDPRSPAFLRLVRGVCAAAEAAGIWVGVCGDTAGDPELATLLVGLGVTELSMAAPLIPRVKQHLRGLSLADAREAARGAAGE